MDGLNSVDAGQGSVVDSQIDNQNNTPVDGGSESINSQSNEKPGEKQTQSREDNEAWKRMRLEKENAEKEAAELKRDMDYIKKYKSYGITSRDDLAQYGYNTWEELDLAVEAQQKNIDPEVYNRLTQAEKTAQQAVEKLSKYERREVIDQELDMWKKDETYGEFFSKWEKEIKELALQNNADLYPAMLAVMGTKAKELKPPNIEEIKKSAVKEYIESLKGQKPVLGGGNTPAIVTKQSNSWDDARKGALEFLRQTKE